jgi:Zn-dependent protease
MNSLQQGSIRLFRFSGIDVFLHWSWFLVAAYEIRGGGLGAYSSVAWSVFEYLALFLIVMVHEFGHALACRQVGGTANQIVLWPFGGVAYVNPPQRPAATLWSIVAGPLVNVTLIPILGALGALGNSQGWAETAPDFSQFLHAVWLINLGLLIFNILPIYPLDGGKILWALLWFPLGRARSLMVAAIIGFVGLVGFIGFAFLQRSVWLGALALFLLLNCWSGLQRARALLRFAKLPRRAGFACPECKASPPIGEFWVCGQCHKPFDTFLTQGVCPNCSTRFDVTSCLDCGRAHPMREWIGHVVPRPMG